MEITPSGLLHRKTQPKPLAVMATYHTVHQKLWTDPVMEDLHPLARYLFIYLLTNPHRNQAGLYSISLRRIARETGLDSSEVRVYLTELQQARRVQYNPETQVVWVVNIVRHISLSPNVAKAIFKAVDSCSSEDLRGRFWAVYKPLLSPFGAPTKPLPSPLPAPWEGLPSPFKEESAKNNKKTDNEGAAKGLPSPLQGASVFDRIQTSTEDTGTGIDSSTSNTSTTTRAREARPKSQHEVYLLWLERQYAKPVEESAKFWDFYTSKGWLVGKAPMKDWKAAAANWNRSVLERLGRPSPNGAPPPAAASRGDVLNVRP